LVSSPKGRSSRKHRKTVEFWRNRIPKICVICAKINELPRNSTSRICTFVQTVQNESWRSLRDDSLF
jgi:hypothetical protein